MTSPRSRGIAAGTAVRLGQEHGYPALRQALLGAGRGRFRADVDCAAALALFGLRRPNAPEPTVVIRGKERLDGRDHPAVRARPQTDDLDVFKLWIGVPDWAIRDGICARPVMLPSLPPERLDRPLAALSATEHLELRKAANAYLFDDSALWNKYRGVIVRHLAPFRIAVYAYSSLEIAPGGCLEIAETPAVLVVDRLALHETGRLDITATARLVLDSLETKGKAPQACPTTTSL
jgi:hypothetical protein